jgi:hypothetical protein
MFVLRSAFIQNNCVMQVRLWKVWSLSAQSLSFIQELTAPLLRDLVLRVGQHHGRERREHQTHANA